MLPNPSTFLGQTSAELNYNKDKPRPRDRRYLEHMSTHHNIETISSDKLSANVKIINIIINFENLIIVIWSIDDLAQLKSGLK